uniref:Uncharacterized protein n=1 Tax=Romanomermis culicivorax TaxID=13658 RepID=A0A915JRT4_ROMCU
MLKPRNHRQIQQTGQQRIVAISLSIGRRHETGADIVSQSDGATERDAGQQQSCDRLGALTLTSTRMYHEMIRPLSIPALLTCIW